MNAKTMAFYIDSLISFTLLSHAWKHGFLDARHYANLPYLNQNGKTLNNALHSEVEIDVK